MLKLSGIRKSYLSGAQKVEALKGIDLEFRNSEFVSILGPSGCGKTTLLNIIGGLDHYTDGDLVIKGRSTKNYKDSDWDTYRNHSVGFVFQNYNLIPHQSVLSNVEIALTLSGVSKKERRSRAKSALERVGLKDQMNKKPNQMSGGQMQRVAIARAIVNDPEILLADEPTGALDTETSLQVLEILKEISKDRLVIMVTHNPELAEKYSTRIINLVDGRITGDTEPYSSENETVARKYEPKKNRSMSFFTALGLSINNLLTKKGRTIMTCFAGSIGIIGIALILSVSTGVNAFIDKVQQDTLAKYPLTIEKESVDMSAMLEAMNGSAATENQHDNDKVYASDALYKMFTSMMSVTTTKNNIKDFKTFIEQSEEFKSHTSAIKYTYPTIMNMYLENGEGKIVKADSKTVLADMYASMGVTIGGTTSTMLQSYSNALKVWEELLEGENDELISPMLKEQYDLLHGSWPSSANEVVLVLNERNEVSDFVLYALGLKSSEELNEMMKAAMKGEKIEYVEQSWKYEDICNMSFRLILEVDHWQKQIDGTYINLSETETGLSYLYNDKTKYTEIKISGIIKPNDNAIYAMLGGSLGYTTALTDMIIDKTAKSEIVLKQLADDKTDVFTGLPFASTVTEPTKEDKITAVKNYFASLSVEEKAKLFVTIASVPSDEYVEGALKNYVADKTREQIVNDLVTAYADKMGATDLESIREYFATMSDDEVFKLYSEQVKAVIKATYAENVVKSFIGKKPQDIALMLDNTPFSDEQYESFYSLYLPLSVSDAEYDTNLDILGYVDFNNPSQIIIYSPTFEDKNEVSDLIAEYNKTVAEENQIKATDYVKLLMSSVSTVINAISYVLIAFVAISLIVSSIMIGVITNISVLERTKEIGILRAVGASKSDIGSVFNAETFIIGLFSGLFGIGITLLLIVPINAILHYFTGIPYLNAQLPVQGGVVLVVLSMLLTLLAGLVPANSASKKDPVVALRSE